MIIENPLNGTIAAGLGGGVTTNKRITTTRINTYRITINCPETNGAALLFAFAVPQNTEPPTFAPPTDPLDIAHCIARVAPNGSATLELPDMDRRNGEHYDLSKLYVQGANATDAYMIRYQSRVDA